MAEGPGDDQAPRQAGDQPAGPSSERAQRHGAAPGKGNTPARTPLRHTNAGTTLTAQASGNVQLVKPAGASRFRKTFAWKKETLKAKRRPKAKKKEGKVLRAKGRKQEGQGGKGLGKTPPPPPPAKKRPLVTEPGPSAKARQETDAEYSYYSESDADPSLSQ